jgi:cobalamin-dependent methionine synthase I
MLDINPGRLSRSRRDRMRFMVEAVQEAVDLPLILDSAQPDVLTEAAAACVRKPVINAVSLEPEKIDSLPFLAAERDLDLIAVLLDDNIQAPAHVDHKIALALEIAERCGNAGLPPGRLIFDPLSPTMRWPDARFRLGQCIETVRLLSTGAAFGEPVRTLAGTSNLRSGQRSVYPARLEEAYLLMLAGGGLTYGLCDVFVPEIVDAARQIDEMTPEC